MNRKLRSCGRKPVAAPGAVGTPHSSCNGGNSKPPRKNEPPRAGYYTGVTPEKPNE
ncbi:MAG TPA: hypothetical protein PLB87_10490 [Prolixibacteraceae bacterium]|nr:hypothetical protein [Prolixibacteraceae bacterium]